VGTSCCGGRDRAAAYAFGCPQVLSEKTVLTGLDRARHISALPGGSYEVSSVPIVESSREESTPRQQDRAAVRAWFTELKRLRK
jgi:hypothetical protein